MLKRLITISSVIASALVWASSAGADTITIGLQEAGTNGGAITNEGGSPFSGSYGTFSTVDVTGASGTSPPVVFDSTTTDFVTSTAGTLTVFVTDSGITGPLSAAQGFLSTFTSNMLTSGWNLTEETLISSTNALFSGTTLSSTPFSSTGTVSGTATGNTGAGPSYSITEEYIIAANGPGNTNDTIDIQSTPIPGTLPLLAGGLIGLWAFGRKRVKGRLNSALA